MEADGPERDPKVDGAAEEGERGALWRRDVEVHAVLRPAVAVGPVLLAFGGVEREAVDVVRGGTAGDAHDAVAGLAQADRLALHLENYQEECVQISNDEQLPVV